MAATNASIFASSTQPCFSVTTSRSHSITNTFVGSEVDKLCDRVLALDVAVNGGTKVSDKEFVVTTKLLMRKLLKLDGIKAEGEARLQRKAEVFYYTGCIISCTPRSNICGCISSLSAGLVGSVPSCRWSGCYWAGVRYPWTFVGCLGGMVYGRRWFLSQKLSRHSS